MIFDMCDKKAHKLCDISLLTNCIVESCTLHYVLVLDQGIVMNE